MCGRQYLYELFKMLLKYPEISFLKMVFDKKFNLKKRDYGCFPLRNQENDSISLCAPWRADVTMYSLGTHFYSPEERNIKLVSKHDQKIRRENIEGERAGGP